MLGGASNFHLKIDLTSLHASSPRTIKLCISSVYMESKLFNLAKEPRTVAKEEGFSTKITPNCKSLLVLAPPSCLR